MERFALAAISLLMAGSASAADLRRPVPMKAPAPAPVAPYNWTGCYLGAGGGYGMYKQESRYINPTTLPNDNGGDGWFGTVQVGCDYQVGSNIVIGAFADYDFSGIKGDMALPAFAQIGEEKLKSSWAAGGRIGWLPFQQLLVFASGGYTQARFGEVVLIDVTTGAPVGLSVAKNAYEGWFIGSGYEYGIGWLPGLFWKTEYRFANYGSERVPVLQAGVPTGEFVESRKHVHTVRSELVWRFNFGGLPAESASAADLRRLMPVKAPTPAPVAPYNWTGCYVGGGGGYGMYKQESRYINPTTLPNDNGGDGWFGTVQVGCDHQVGSNIVIGAFADYDFSGIKGDLALPAFDEVGEEKLKNSWAAGGRIGWLPFQQLLVFASGGYTQARFGEVPLVDVNTGVPLGLSVAKNTYEGWFVGSGYEYGIGWLPGLFWKTEYRFANYGAEQVPVLQAGVPTGEFVESRKHVHTVRSELVWRFNFGGPLVARY